MAHYPPVVTTGDKSFSAMSNISGVVVGDVSGPAQVIGTQNNYNYGSKDKLSKICRWLSAPDPYLNYNKALKLRQADTGGWFLKGSEYIEWKEKDASPLWLYGTPGCGKTVLSSAVIKDVLEDCRGNSGRVACFFFAFDDVQKQDPESMLRSLIWQLSWQPDGIPTNLNKLFSSCQNGQRQPSADELQEALQSRIQELPQVYVVLDALDECARAQRTELMKMLETMAGWRLRNLHLLVTSRREPDIESALKKITDGQRRICLQSDLVDEDIKVYVHHRLATDDTLERWRGKDIEQEIETELSRKAKGMFRWAACQLDSLAKCLNRKALREALATLPSTLDQTYERILSTISEDYSEYALRILRWLTYSVGPLSVRQIAEVVAIDTERNPPFGPIFERDEVLEDPLDALYICSSLITITSHNKSSRSEGTVALAHYSVQEYLVSNRILTGEAAKYGMRDDVCHDVMARSCLGYLLQLEQAELPESFLQDFRLAKYSAECWVDHVRKKREQTEEMDQLIIRLFSKNSSYINWVRLYDPGKPPIFRHWFDDLEEEISDPLYYAAKLGLERVVKLLLDAGADINAQKREFHGSALQVASRRGHELVVELLLDAGANVNAYNGGGGSALYLASEYGHKLIAELLLNRGADINAQSGARDGSALQVASFYSKELVIQLLLNAGAEVNAPSRFYGSALQAASGKDCERIVELLLNAGADVNAEGPYGSALQVASRHGCRSIVEMLLNAGADVNARSRDSKTALWEASHRGYNEIVKLLLDADADVNAQGLFSSPLQTASSNGHEQIVKLLVDAGAVPLQSHDVTTLNSTESSSSESIEDDELGRTLLLQSRHERRLRSTIFDIEADTQHPPLQPHRTYKPPRCRR